MSASYGEEVIVNALGFNESHDDSFLESLTTLGTTDGSYNFMHESDGEQGRRKQARLTNNGRIYILEA
jgi:hypothetical protein